MPMQLELFPFDCLTEKEKQQIIAAMRQSYWFIRNLRGGRFGQAKIRRHYRLIAEQKKRLMSSGVPKEEILLLLRHLRGQCSGKKQPFKPCKYCT